MAGFIDFSRREINDVSEELLVELRKHLPRYCEPELYDGLDWSGAEDFSDLIPTELQAEYQEIFEWATDADQHGIDELLVEDPDAPRP